MEALGAYPYPLMGFARKSDGWDSSAWESGGLGFACWFATWVS